MNKKNQERPQKLASILSLTFVPHTMTQPNQMIYVGNCAPAASPQLMPNAHLRHHKWTILNICFCSSRTNVLNYNEKSSRLPLHKAPFPTHPISWAMHSLDFSLKFLQPKQEGIMQEQCLIPHQGPSQQVLLWWNFASGELLKGNVMEFAAVQCGKEGTDWE